MNLRFDVSFPTLDIRIEPGYAEKIKGYNNFRAGIIDVLNVRVCVKGFTDNDRDQTKMVIEYTEDYHYASSFGEVIGRAEEYAREYCKKLGLGASESPEEDQTEVKKGGLEASRLSYEGAEFSGVITASR